ncbi:MAG: HD domain-containing protein, partial [Alphaproteobacteria bacterium]|nr:HD domain-containing protein [Alphaproteobacteria bacterium]
MDLYSKAQNLLQLQYKKNFEVVKDSLYHKSYVNEKIRHSLQVAGAGNGILRNEPYFQNKTAEFIEITKIAILLHDIFRFNEVRFMYENKPRIDHGTKGAEFLAQIPEFNNPLILLPVKHHGHMIEKFYEDEDYTSIDNEQLKDQIEHIIFAVRDADKIANWQILTKEYENMRLVWLPYPNDRTEKQGIISDNVLESFINCEVVPHSYLKTNADCLVSVLAWLFDINYAYSIKYALRLNIFVGFENMMSDLKVEQSKIDSITNIIKNYVNRRFFVRIKIMKHQLLFLSMLLAGTTLSTVTYAGNYDGQLDENKFSTSANVTWEKVGEDQKNEVDVVAIKLPNEQTEYFKYTYIGSASRDVYKSQKNDLSGIINADFIDAVALPTAQNEYYGGAIYNEASIDSITGDFIRNNASSSTGWMAYKGGAIYSKGTIGDIAGDFIANSVGASSSYSEADGGAVYNDSTMGKITGNFIGNYATSNSSTNGGGIYNNGILGDITGNFYGNYAKGPYASFGGGIYNKNTLNNITGDFVGNYAIATEQF